jgi:hypothetical protein
VVAAVVVGADVVAAGTTTTTFVDGGLVSGALVTGGLVAGACVGGGLVAGGRVAGGFVGRVGSVGLTSGRDVVGVLGSLPTVVVTAIDVGDVSIGWLTVGRSPLDDPPEPHELAAKTATISQVLRRPLTWTAILAHRGTNVCTPR